MERKWQRPITLINGKDMDFISPVSKYHAFIDGVSLCGKHQIQKKFIQRHDFNVPVMEAKILKNKHAACKVCLKKIGE